MSDEALAGYRDGLNDSRDTLPDSLSNRSEVYRVAWMNGRDDRLGKPRAAASTIRAQMEEARQKETRHD